MMSKLSGVLLVLAGLGVGAFALPLFPEADDPRGAPAARTREESARAAMTVRLAAMQDPPAVTPVAPVVNARSSEPLPAAPPAPIPAVRVPLPPPVAASAPQAQRAVRLPVRVPLSNQRADEGLPLDRAALTREIQRELKRVGCYGGEINGAWTQSTRRGMKAFTDRVNATLPLEQPDSVLLAIVQNHAAAACGAPCPVGQGLADDGRCLPHAIIAYARKHPQAEAEPKDAAPRANEAAAPWAFPPAATEPGRMALAGPKAEDLPPDANQNPQAEQQRQAAARRRNANRGNGGQLPRWARALFSP